MRRTREMWSDAHHIAQNWVIKFNDSMFFSSLFWDTFKWKYLRTTAEVDVRVKRKSIEKITRFKLLGFIPAVNLLLPQVVNVHIKEWAERLKEEILKFFWKWKMSFILWLLPRSAKYGFWDHCNVQNFGFIKLSFEVNSWISETKERKKWKNPFKQKPWSKEMNDSGNEAEWTMEEISYNIYYYMWTLIQIENQFSSYFQFYSLLLFLLVCFILQLGITAHIQFSS